MSASLLAEPLLWSRRLGKTLRVVSTTFVLSPGDPKPPFFPLLFPVAGFEKRESNPKFGPNDVLIVIEGGRRM